VHFSTSQLSLRNSSMPLIQDVGIWRWDAIVLMTSGLEFRWSQASGRSIRNAFLLKQEISVSFIRNKTILLEFLRTKLPISIVNRFGRQTNIRYRDGGTEQNALTWREGRTAVPILRKENYRTVMLISNCDSGVRHPMFGHIPLMYAHFVFGTPRVWYSGLPERQTFEQLKVQTKCGAFKWQQICSGQKRFAGYAFVYLEIVVNFNEMITTRCQYLNA
jgi:hypothetical protein